MSYDETDRFLYQAQILTALLNLLEEAGLVRYIQTMQDGVQAVELEISPLAGESVVPFFKQIL